MVLCHLHNDFLCCCIGVMCLQNDFWMSTKTLHDLKDYVEPSVFLCVLTTTPCVLLRLYVTFYNDGLQPSQWLWYSQWLVPFTVTLFDLSTDYLISTLRYTFLYIPPQITAALRLAMRSSVSLCGHQNACVQSKWLCESSFMTLCEPNNDIACHSQWFLMPSQRLVYPHMILFSQRFCVTIIVSLCMLTTNVTFTATLYTFKMSL